jgi:uncharacterized damage-inducible protein DinB
MRVVRKNTIQLAEEIPESSYHYRPSPESRSVAETLVHIAWLASADRVVHEEQHVEAFASFDLGALLTTSEVEEMRPRSKAEIIDLLRTEGDRYVRWVEELPEAFFLETILMPSGAMVTRFEMLMGTKEHEMQHRAQLTVIQRLLGLVPHFTRNLPVSRAPALV